VYLSECIRQQYHANALVLKNTKPFDVSRLSEKRDSFRKEDFMRLLRRVIKIKRKGCASLLLLAEQVDMLLNAEVQNYVNNGLKYADIKDMLDKLLIITKTQRLVDTQNKFASVIQDCLNANQYLRIYGEQQKFNSVYRSRQPSI